MNNPLLDSLYYIRIPKGFKMEGFVFDETIPLPVQKKDEKSELDISQDDIASLNAEQIISGILILLSYDKENPHLQYYRDFVLKVRPSIKTELLSCAIAKTKNEEWEVAQQMFDALKGVDPLDMAITLNTALFYDQWGTALSKVSKENLAKDYNNKALALYEECLTLDSPLPDAYFNLGFFYLKLEEFAKAKETFESYLALVVDKTDEELGENGIYKKERAGQIIDNIYNQRLDAVEFHKAYELINKNHEEDALTYLNNFLHKNPTVSNGWFMLGWALRKLKRFSEAQEAFQKALDFGMTENADCWNELAICQIENGQKQKAKESLFTALSLDTESTKIISNLAYYYLHEGNKAEAKKYFLTVLEIDSNDEIAKSELARLED